MVKKSSGQGANPATPTVAKHSNASSSVSGDRKVSPHTNVPTIIPTGSSPNGGRATDTTSWGVDNVDDINRSKQSSRRKSNAQQPEPPSPTRTRHWLNFRTGDLQVIVAETHVFRLHQEIMIVHSRFFREHLQMDDDEAATAPSPEDIPVVSLRDISPDAFTDVLDLIYLRPGAEVRRPTSRQQVEQLLYTAHILGMPEITEFAMNSLASDFAYTPVSLYLLAGKLSLPSWQFKCIRELVYRTRPLSNEEAKALETLTTARVSRLREEFRARIFSRFEPVVDPEKYYQETHHQSGDDSDLVKWSSTAGRTTGIRSDLGKCQQAILEALKVVFNADGLRSDRERRLIREDVSVTMNLVEWLRLEKTGGVPVLCNGCKASVEKAARIYCRQDEMDERIERELSKTYEC
ncbi:BTB/POZ domain containing protein [Ceratobasidium theobromae]|uniref:BTB/POZ domain containing protein n=1 Tax=Ceratobasidium theobromae TaxID=1582974 RepID=A0A5N5QGK2_9AGAM|nr:BTB/POZ domain containing protein [Ceratobasidium theobromae]